MARIVAIDFGLKRVGLAVTDPMQMIATALTTVENADAITYLKDYLSKNEVECFVIGDPRQMDGTPSEVANHISNFIHKLKNAFPGMQVHKVDERFTSKIAAQSLFDSGLKKKQRQDKKLLDSVSATLILQTYLEMK